MKRRFARLTLAGACIAMLAGGLVPSAASGATVADKVAQAQQLKAEIDANGEKISILAERYNGAQIALEAATRSISGIKSQDCSGAGSNRPHRRHRRPPRRRAVHERGQPVADRLDGRVECERSREPVGVRRGHRRS